MWSGWRREVMHTLSFARKFFKWLSQFTLPPAGVRTFVVSYANGTWH